jgi:preprotein translocase subunit SecG
MTTLHTVGLVGHVLISLAIIGLVLVQRGKGAEAGAAFGAGASGTVFGARGSANFLSRSTALLATLFFVSSLSLAYLGSQRPVAKSLMDEVTAPATEAADALPVPDGDDADSDLPSLPAGETPAPADGESEGSP